MGPTSRGSVSGSSHFAGKTNQPYSLSNGHQHTTTSASGSSLPTSSSSSSSSSHPLTDSGKRPRSTSTLGGLSSPRMTRLRLRIHALSSSTPLRYLRLPTSRKLRLAYLSLFFILLLLFLLPTLLTSAFPRLRLPTHPLDPQASAAFSLTKPRLDQGGNEIPDESEGQQQVEIQRSFEEPDFALLSSRQPRDVGCDVPIVWDPMVSNSSTYDPVDLTSSSASSSSTTTGKDQGTPGVLVFLGVFSAAQSADKSPQEMRRRRDLYRTTYFPHFPPNLVTAKFILGLPPLAGMRNPAAAIARAKVVRMIEEERERFGDLVILDVSPACPIPQVLGFGPFRESICWKGRLLS